MGIHTNVKVLCLSDIDIQVDTTNYGVYNPVVIAPRPLPRGVAGAAMILREVRDKWVAAALLVHVRE